MRLRSQSALKSNCLFVLTKFQQIMAELELNGMMPDFANFRSAVTFKLSKYS